MNHKLIFGNTPFEPSRKGILQLEATFYCFEKLVSPPGLEPESLEKRSNTLTYKL